MPPGRREQEQENLPPATGRHDTPPRRAPPSTAVPPIRVYKRRKNLNPEEEEAEEMQMPHPGGGGACEQEETPPHPTPPLLHIYQRRKNLKPDEEEAEEMMPPRGGQQDHLSATTRQRDEDTMPPFPKVDQRRKKLRQLKEQQAAASIPDGPLIKILSPQARKKLRRKLRQLKARQAAASIPEDPLINILSRLPYRSLRRFRCVSRSWRTLCSDPKICKRSPDTLFGFFHYHRDNKNFRFLNLSSRGPPMVDPALPFLRGSYKGFTIEQCCNGLLLCKCLKSDAGRDSCDLLVCNPATENWTVLPALLGGEDGEPVYFGLMDAFLAFDTAIHACFVVLVTLRARLDDVAIYSSENGQWMRGGLEDRVVVTNKCVFLNGCMQFFRMDEPHIVAFDIEGSIGTQFLFEKIQKNPDIVTLQWGSRRGSCILGIQILRKITCMVRFLRIMRMRCGN